MTKCANEYWIHDGEEDFADGDIGDYNHEMIAEAAILNEFIPNIPIETDYLISKDILNQESVNDYDFIRFLMEKYNIEENEAIDDAYDVNYITWLMTGDDEKQTPKVIELFNALKDPRKWVVVNWDWIRVQGKFVEMNKINENSLRSLARSLERIYDEDVENMSFTISSWNPQMYYQDVPFDSIQSGDLSQKMKIKEETPNISNIKQIPNKYYSDFGD